MTFPFFMILDRGYLDHWKTNLLRQLTGLPNAAELPIRLWEYCEARRDDAIDDRSGLIIAGICRAPMEPKKLTEALVQCRFLDKTREGFTVHGWRERNHSWLAKIEGGKKRAASAKRGTNGQLGTPAQAGSSQLAGQHDATLPLEAGRSAGAEEWRGVEKSREPADLPPQARREGGNGQLLTETTNRILGLFDAGKKRRLGREAEGELARQEEALPLVDEEWRLLAWWLRLPPEESDPFLRDGSRPKDADKLAIRLFTELDRAKAHAKKNGPGAQKKEGPAWPDGAREWLATTFPTGEIPARFDDLPRDIRDLWQKREGKVA